MFGHHRRGHCNLGNLGNLGNPGNPRILVDELRASRLRNRFSNLETEI